MYHDTPEQYLQSSIYGFYRSDLTQNVNNRNSYTFDGRSIWWNEKWGAWRIGHTVFKGSDRSLAKLEEQNGFCLLNDTANIVPQIENWMISDHTGRFEITDLIKIRCRYEPHQEGNVKISCILFCSFRFLCQIILYILQNFSLLFQYLYRAER